MPSSNENPYSELLAGIAKEEGFRATRYKGRGEKYETIGFGHYLDNTHNYSELAKALAISNPENLTKEDGLKLLQYDVDLKKKQFQQEYPTVDPRIAEKMLTVRFQFSPQGFEKLFGEALRKNDIGTIQSTLSRVGIKFRDERKLGGVYKRWMSVVNSLNDPSLLEQ